MGGMGKVAGRVTKRQRNRVTEEGEGRNGRPRPTKRAEFF